MFRGQKFINIKNDKDIELQVIDWYATNEAPVDNEEEDCNDSDGSEDSKTKYKTKEFMIKAYGVTLKGTSVCVNITNFPPYFYIEVPSDWTLRKCRVLVESIKNDRNYPPYLKDSIVNFDIVERKKFWGFTNNKLFKFIRIMFKNTSALYSCNKILQKKLKVPSCKANKYEVFESNIPPLLRFVHINKLNPAGWIKLSKRNYEVVYNKTANTQLEVSIDWRKVEHIEKSEMAPFIIASYDIEADSSHGDFPLPEKTYKKLATEIVSNYKNNKFDTNKDHKKVEKIITNYLDSAFNNGDEENEISKIYTKRNIKPNKFQIQIIAKKVRLLMNRKESYKIMIADILSKYQETELKEDDDEGLEINLDNDKRIKDIIEDCFCDEQNNKSIFGVSKIFTKQNNKPKHSEIKSISKKLMLYYKKFIDNTDDDDLGILFDVLEHYSKIYYFDKTQDKVDYISSKIDEEPEIIKSLLTKITSVSNQFMSVINDIFPEIDDSVETKIKRIDDLLTNAFPPVEGDKVIQIGTTVQRYGEKECFVKHIATLDTCSKIDGCIVEECKTEREVLLAWTKFIQKLDPDIITGYNIFGFDYEYMYRRAKELNCVPEFSQLSRIKDKESELIDKTLSSSALGENKLKYIEMEGRVQLDLFKIIQRDHNLVSYKLDYVAETFIKDKINSIDHCEDKDTSCMKIKGIINLNLGNFITLNINNDKYNKGEKIKIKDIDYENEMITTKKLNIDTSIKGYYEWTLAKDDVSPNDIFRFQKGTADDRRTIAVYCIQDCALCLHIINKLQIITNNIAMANVCFVPLSFIFLRGQGIKILSLVSRRCRQENFVLPVIKCKQDTGFKFRNDKFDYEAEDDIVEGAGDDGYEGAIVLKPHPGIYLDKYTVVLDYASLYPSSMISENLCHTSIIMDDKYMGDQGVKELEKLGYGYVDITYDVYKWIDPNIKSKGKVKTGVKTCRFAQPPNGEKSVIPRILQDLLKARKDTKKRMKKETDEFQKSVLDGLQLAFKITANSLYGQIGARTSAIYLKDIAASTTATGRKLLYLAKDKTEEKFEGAKAIYGDTDSVFIDFTPKDESGKLMTGKEGLKKAIDLGVQAEEHIQQFLKPPHKLEYEKTFWPFILFSKKRYIGYKYEFDVDKYKETSMGIVLKRRDNADIVKHVYGSVINILLKERNLSKSISNLQSQLMDLLNGKFPLEMLIISKSLRGYYKNPTQIAHKVLADRMGKRDPGNKPMVNDRIPFVYIETKEYKGQQILQGDRVEHPDFIRENNIRPDYKFYITNQIMKPVCQIYALIVEKLEGYNKGKGYYETKFNYYEKLRGIEKAKEKISDMKLKDTSDIIFGEVLRKATNKKNKSHEITDFFKVRK